MKSYTDLVARILSEGEWSTNRTSERTLTIFGAHMEFDLREGFPMVTEKAVPFKSVIGELCGFVRGCTDVRDFQELGTHIWDANAEAPYWVNNYHRKYAGHLGRIYGAQWREWMAEQDGRTYTVLDQLQDLIDGLRHDPFSRRHIVTAWNPAELNKMALPPCHIMFQCHVSVDGHLDLQMYQRSADAFLGVPFNIASYAALLTYLGSMTGLTPRRLFMTLGNTHLYESQIELAREMVLRDARPLPTLKVELPDGRGLDDIHPDMFTLTGYDPHPPMPVAMVV